MYPTHDRICASLCALVEECEGLLKKFFVLYYVTRGAWWNFRERLTTSLACQVRWGGIGGHIIVCGILTGGKSSALAARTAASMEPIAKFGLAKNTQIAIFKFDLVFLERRV